MNIQNYIPDENKFKLAGPPEWWLQQLWYFDDSLVVVPSRMGFYYRLAQRRLPSLTTSVVNKALWNESDTHMLARYNLVPVTTILATANWSNPYLFEELRRRNVHRMGGAEKVTRDLEEAEWQEEIKRRQENDELLTSISRDGWGLYRKKIGIRSHMYVPKTRNGQIPRHPKANSNAPGLIIK